MSDPATGPDSAPDTGIVAIGRNEGERLRRCLASVPAGMPVAYVDSASTDGSAAYARDRGAIVVELDLARPFTAARARAEGVAALLAAHPGLACLQFIDGDCEVEPGWIDTARRFLAETPRAGVVCGRRRERHPEASFYNALADREWDTPIGEAAACGGDALYRRSAYEAAGGFDAAMIAGEEPELCARLRAAGWAVWRIDAPMTVHDAAMHRFGQWWLRAVRSGFGYAQAWSRAGLYRRELARVAFWTLAVVAAGLVAALVVGPAGLLLAPLLWGAQWLRLARRSGAREAALLVAGKWAELIGASRFALAALRGRRSGTIFYK